MKKNTLLILILFLSTTLFLAQEEDKKQDESKDFCFVEKVEPVPEKMKAGFESISAKDAEAYLRFLASDSLEGRSTASKMYNIAAEFAATLFRLWGVEPAGDPRQQARPGFFTREEPEKKKSKEERSYFQEVRLKEVLEGRSSSVILEIRQGPSRKIRTLYPGIDYAFSSWNNEQLSAPVVFVGCGISEKSIKFDEYKGLDVKGKMVLMFSGIPRQDKKDSPFKKGKLKEKYFPQRRRWWGNPRIKLAEEKGAAAVLMVESSPGKPDISQRARPSRRINDEEPIIPWEELPRLLLVGVPTPERWQTLPTIHISRETANILLGLTGESVESLVKKIDCDLKPQSRKLPGAYITAKTEIKVKLTSCRNVLGLVEGSDPELKNEVIVIGAHLDHFGKLGDYIFNGADDNGSGSVGVLELAQAFAANPVKPKRSILFALWTGEERGLLGSRYYVENPYAPLKKTFACLNLDMISRTWDKEKLLKTGRIWGKEIPKTTLEKIDVKKFLVASCDEKSPQMVETLERCNRFVGMSLYIRKSAGGSGSDHASFAYKKIPWASFHAAMTDDYHTPKDSVDKVSFDLIQQVTRLTFMTAFKLADNK